MAKPDQVLVIDPPTELRFRGPFTAPVTSFMKLYNPTERNICFKIKTTAPKKYCVRPNAGLLEPSKGVEVAVSLQPFEYDPAEKNKHKFMVLSTIPPDGETSPESIWANVSSEDTMDSKLRCVFEMPVEREGPIKEEKEVAAGDAWGNVLAAKRQPDPTPDIAKDTKILRPEENTVLRQENLELREELLKLKKTVSAQAAEIRSVTVGRQMQQQQPQGREITDFVIAFFIVIFGIILGKWLL